ncbi:MAG: hypothetical protein IPO75_17295 [Betaproteobacteria bacterium]|nr:hypothetical protein [Betaproteobacteria bacterium]
MDRNMSRFLKKLLIYLLPFVVILCIPAMVFVETGEITAVSRVIDLQVTSRIPVLFGRAYSDPTPYYKLESVLRRRPDVLALGTSRVLAVRSNFFSPELSFFNAGNGVTRLRHFRLFLERIPKGAEPRLIFLGLDQYLFNDAFDSLLPDGMELAWAAEERIAEVFFSNWTKVYGDYWEQKFRLADLVAETGERRIGLNAVAHANGFRSDGSYTWAEFVADPWNPKNPDFEFQNTFDRIQMGDRRFQYAEHVSEKALLELDALLRECKARGIYVAAFLPPFAHAVFEKMQSMPKQYGYLRELEPSLRLIFNKSGFSLYDSSDLASLGASDKETIDGFHGSEKAYLRLFLKMIESDLRLKTFARDPAFLRGRLDAASDHVVFGIAER